MSSVSLKTWLSDDSTPVLENDAKMRKEDDQLLREPEPFYFVDDVTLEFRSLEEHVALGKVDAFRQILKRLDKSDTLVRKKQEQDVASEADQHSSNKEAVKKVGNSMFKNDVQQTEPRPHEIHLSQASEQSIEAVEHERSAVVASKPVIQNIEAAEPVETITFHRRSPRGYGDQWSVSEESFVSDEECSSSDENSTIVLDTVDSPRPQEPLQQSIYFSQDVTAMDDHDVAIATLESLNWDMEKAINNMMGDADVRAAADNVNDIEEIEDLTPRATANTTVVGEPQFAMPYLFDNDDEDDGPMVGSSRATRSGARFGAVSSNGFAHTRQVLANLAAVAHRTDSSSAASASGSRNGVAESDDDMVVESDDDYAVGHDDVESVSSIKNYEGMVPLIPTDSTSVEEAQQNFWVVFEARFASQHGCVMPSFFTGSLHEAVRKAFEAPGRPVCERKPLAIYIHNDKSIAANIFPTMVMCREEISTLLRCQYILWAWDVTLKENEIQLLDWMTMLGMNQARHNLSALSRDAEKFPLLIIITKGKVTFGVMDVCTGMTDYQNVMEKLVHGVDAFTQIRMAEEVQRKREEREEILREQYEKSLQADKSRMEARVREAREAREEEQKRVEAEEREHINRAQLASELPNEPDEKAPDAIMVKCRLPEGEQLLDGDVHGFLSSSAAVTEEPPKFSNQPKKVAQSSLHSEPVKKRPQPRKTSGLVWSSNQVQNPKFFQNAKKHTTKRDMELWITGASRILQQFETQLRAFSADTDELSFGGMILLPHSVFEPLLRTNPQFPLIFKVTNSSLGIPLSTHCGVLEFEAPEGQCILPNWMMSQLHLSDGHVVRVESATLPMATSVKLESLSVDFLGGVDCPHAVLTDQLEKKFVCLTKHDKVAFMYAGRAFEFVVQEVKPGPWKAVCVIDCDLNLEIDNRSDFTRMTSRTREKGSATTICRP